MTAAPAPESGSVRRLWLLGAILTFWSFGFTTMMGSDLWWHLASGRWICEARTLTFKDPWTFTRFGQPWLNHEWLADVLYHGWTSLLGMESLVWWKWAMLVSAFALLFVILRKLSGSSLAAYLASVLAIAVGAPFYDLRPQLYSVLGFMVLLRVALWPSRLRWLLPVGFLLWVNLHGGFFFGLVALAVIFVVARLCGEGARKTLPLYLACLLACLVNPGGPRAYGFPLRYALDTSSPFRQLGEWLPVWEPGGLRSALFYPSIAVFVLSAVVVFAAGLHRKQRRLTFTHLALGLLTLVMSLKSRRFIPFFGITQSLLLAPALAALLARLSPKVVARIPTFARSAAWQLLPPALAVGLGAFRLAPYPLTSRAFLCLTGQDYFPVEALNVAEANHLAGKVFAFYNWGGYLHLRTGGRLQVYIDGRGDTVFDDLTYLQYVRVLSRWSGWEDVVNASGADYFLWPSSKREQVQVLRDSGRWRVLYADHVAALLIRADRPRPEPLLPSPDSAWRELALGWNASLGNHLPEAEQHLQRALVLMPNLRSACEWLASIQARGDRLADAEATLDRCRRSFPDPERYRAMLAEFRGRGEAGR